MPAFDSARQDHRNGPFVANGPPPRRSHPPHVIGTQIQQVRIPSGDQITDHDLPLRVPQDDRRNRVSRAAHLGTGTHGRRLNDTRVIRKRSAGFAGEVKSGEVKSGEVKSGEVKSGEVKSAQ